VTGVQTCALPICHLGDDALAANADARALAQRHGILPLRRRAGGGEAEAEADAEQGFKGAASGRHGAGA
jgi:hypothetical protein